jgi:hypothetical protein
MICPPSRSSIVSAATATVPASPPLLPWLASLKIPVKASEPSPETSRRPAVTVTPPASPAA